MRIYTYQQPSKPIHSPKQPDEEIQSSTLEGLLNIRNLKNLTENSLDIVIEKIEKLTLQVAEWVSLTGFTKMQNFPLSFQKV